MPRDAYRLVTSRICGFTPNISGNTMMPRVAFPPSGSATHASIVVPSSTLISTCFEVMLDMMAKRLSYEGAVYDRASYERAIRFTESYRDRRRVPGSGV